MKQILAICFAALYLLTACAPASAEPAPTPMPEPETITEIKLATDDEALNSLIQREVDKQNDIEIAEEATPAPEPEDDDGAEEAAVPAENRITVAVAHMPTAEDAGRLSSPCVIYTDDEALIGEGMSAVVIEENAAVKAAWTALCQYPSHCSPIRLLSLVESAESASYLMYEDMLNSGMLQNKGEYIADKAEIPVDEWLKETLDGVTVGLLDTIYAETPELAAAAYKALKAAERNDTVEVICPEMTGELVELMIEDHWLMGAAVFVDQGNIASEIIRLAEKLAEDGEAERVDIEPVIITSDEVMELYNAGMTDVSEIINQLSK